VACPFPEQKIALDTNTKVEKISRHAVNPQKEAIEELLTLDKLEITEEFAGGFSTTNCIESANAQIQKYTVRVTHWSSSDQRY